MTDLWHVDQIVMVFFLNIDSYRPMCHLQVAIPGVFVILCILVWSGDVNGQSPLSCSPNSRQPTDCCGDDADWQCGESQSRGRCVPVENVLRHFSTLPIDLTTHQPDTRITYNFGRVCQCEGNYGGWNCSQCKLGWAGDRCEQRSFYLRKNWCHMNATEQLSFHTSLDKMKHSGYSLCSSNIHGRKYSTYDCFQRLHSMAMQELTPWDFAHKVLMTSPLQICLILIIVPCHRVLRS
jgi:hypothetical protein